MQPPVTPAELAALPERVRDFLTMLTYKRPAWSASEAAFIARYIVPTGAQPDSFGNYWLDVRAADDVQNRVLWSSHTDTVHSAGGMQGIIYGDGIATSDSNDCLGADCTAGVWLMVNMIRAGVPGLYVFHRAEEIGGLGSQYIKEHTPEALHGIEIAIAFDRRGFRDVITYQGGQRTASDAFAASFSAALSATGFRWQEYEASTGGTFTDTANYKRIVPECSNIAVGYLHAHGPDESQDVAFACDLLDSLIALDQSKLVAERDPTATEYLYKGKYGTAYRSSYAPYTPPSADEWAELYGLGGSSNDKPLYDLTDTYSDYEVTADSFPRELEAYVYSNPAIVASFLHECGNDVNDLKAFARTLKWGG
jgi:hypothetical protein